MQSPPTPFVENGKPTVIEFVTRVPEDASGLPTLPARYSIQMEDGFSTDVMKRLRELRYDLSFISMRGELREGYGAAVAIDGKKVSAGADPRRAGAAGAIP